MNSFGTNHFVLYTEVVVSLVVKITSMIENGLQSMSFIERFFPSFIWSVHYRRFSSNLHSAYYDWSSSHVEHAACEVVCSANAVVTPAVTWCS